MIKKHVHKYHKINLKYVQVWACALPDCTHHMPPHLEDKVIGKFSICWNCSQSFILNLENMKLEQPICLNCSAPNLAEDLEDILFKGVK